MSAVEESTTTGDSLESMTTRRLETQRQGCQVSEANLGSWAVALEAAACERSGVGWRRAAGGVEGWGVGRWAGGGSLFWRDGVKIYVRIHVRVHVSGCGACAMGHGPFADHGPGPPHSTAHHPAPRPPCPPCTTPATMQAAIDSVAEAFRAQQASAGATRSKAHDGAPALSEEQESLLAGARGAWSRGWRWRHRAVSLGGL